MLEHAGTVRLELPITSAQVKVVFEDTDTRYKQSDYWQNMRMTELQLDIIVFISGNATYSSAKAVSCFECPRIGQLEPTVMLGSRVHATR
ncbi:hypothetical protein CH251_13985 [Rhodococcus sp. 06-462-5]|nr:hypothetical protein CH251_13985 [Rhodococcus sp. 06-462-5]OZE63449.1 hypothetical protein CH270_18360 [Rhodococcus sp. 02-925g]